MHDDLLLNNLLERLASDAKLPGDAALMVYAAFEGAEALQQTLTGAASALPARSLPSSSAAEPVGAYLRAVTVAGFRGIGPRVTLPIRPGPGLTVVAGRNGSGKSSFAEAIEYALTDRNRRWDTKARPGPDWRSGWRNLHDGKNAAIEVELLIEGSAPASATVRHRWPDNADLLEGTSDVLRPGGEPQPVSDLGWDEELSTHRPFLSYNELGEVLGGKASELYDSLWSILGLERINDTHVRLKEAALVLRTAADDARARATALVTRCGDVNDPRAQQAAEALGARAWDLPVIESLVSPGAVDDDPYLGELAALAALTGPRLDDLGQAADALRDAAAGVERLRGSDAERASQDLELLERALRFHEIHGDGPCPVCGEATLDDEWRRQTTHRVQQLHDEATSVRVAQSALRAALDRAHSQVTAPPAELNEGAVTELKLADDPLALWRRFAEAPQEAVALADHLELAGVELAASISSLKDVARLEIEARQDVWRPLAADLWRWLVDARSVLGNADSLMQLTSAAAWVKATAQDWANDRLAPLSREASRIWETLRQESNVSLGPVKLAGTATRRHVELDVTVDGAPGSALGVMSQGELHALALSLFLPRATIPESPFRFLVIDDPVQAMDPAKVDGLARVLAGVAKHRQVLVFTHDDRLPAALRRLRLDGRVLEVTRQQGSRVAIVPSDNPALRYLNDARALVKDDGVPRQVAHAVVAGLCRLALDAACVDRIRTIRLSAGATHSAVESLLEDNPRLYPRMALALFDDEKRARDVLPHLASFGPGAPAAFKECNSGAHGVGARDLSDLLSNTSALVRELLR